MQQRDDIAARRLGILIEQYVEARKKRYDYVSTEQAYQAIRHVLKPAIPDRELDDMVATLAVKNGLAVVFDRQTKASADDVPGTKALINTGLPPSSTTSIRGQTAPYRCVSPEETSDTPAPWACVPQADGRGGFKRRC